MALTTKFVNVDYSYSGAGSVAFSGAVTSTYVTSSYSAIILSAGQTSSRLWFGAGVPTLTINMSATAATFSSVLYTVPSGRTAKVIFNSGGIYLYNQTFPQSSVSASMAMLFSLSASLISSSFSGSPYSGGSARWDIYTQLPIIAGAGESVAIFDYVYMSILINNSVVHSDQFGPSVGSLVTNNISFAGASSYASNLPGPIASPISTTLFASSRAFSNFPTYTSTTFSSVSVTSAQGFPKSGYSVYMGPGQSLVIIQSNVMTLNLQETPGGFSILVSMYGSLVSGTYTLAPSGSLIYPYTLVASFPPISYTYSGSHDWSFIVIEESGS